MIKIVLNNFFLFICNICNYMQYKKGVRVRFFVLKVRQFLCLLISDDRTGKQLSDQFRFNDRKWKSRNIICV
jgi:hypothetical protein